MSSEEESRSLVLIPTWSVAIVLTIFVVVSLLVERSIHCLSNASLFIILWLKKMDRKPVLAAVEKMKEEMMLLGFISLLLPATSNSICGICIPSKFYNGAFYPCSKPNKNQELEDSKRRLLGELNENICKKGYEPFVSDEGLEQLYHFIFVMAITHVSYSCLTMLLAIVKVCFFRQYGSPVVRADYLTSREAFIMNHNLTSKYDFHSYMIRSMEEEFQRIVGLSEPLWGLVVSFMLFNVKGSNLYFWIALVPVALVLLLGAKLQHVIATLALESAGITGYFTEARLQPRDELFWFKKPELLLSLIHFILFQWQFGYDSCFLKHHTMVYIRLILCIKY